MPSVRMLSKAFPTAHIDWWTTSRTHPEIFQALDFLNKIEILPSNPFRMVFRLIAFGPKLGRYDLILDYDQYYQISELIAYFG